MSEQAAGSSEPFYYLSVDRSMYRRRWWFGYKILNVAVIVSDEKFTFYNVDTWFSPVSAERDSKRADYWALPKLKIVWPILNRGRFRAGKVIPLGDYFIESNCQNHEGESLFFVERLQVLPTEVVIDVYKNGNELLFHREEPQEWLMAA